MTRRDVGRPDLADISRASADVERYYDAWADDYERDLAAWGYGAPEAVAGRLRKMLPGIDPGACEVLDAGCGTGLSGRALAARGFDVIDGVDVSPASLAIAERTGVYRRVRRIDFQRLPTPLPAAAYDALVCVGVLTYLPDTAAVLEEFARIVRAGAVLVLTQRSDLFDERACGALLEDLADREVLEIVEVSEPLPYLPGHEAYGEAIGVRCLTLRVPEVRAA